MLRLLLRNLAHRPLRSLLTIGSLAVALFVLTALRAVVLSLESGVRNAASNRLVVESAVSLFVQLPISYQPKIEQVEGVERICKFTWFGGFYQDESNFFAQFGVDAEGLLDIYQDDMQVIEGDVEEFYARKNACLVGRQLMAEFPEWKVGENVPIIGALYPKNDGSAWEFYIAGVYEARMPIDNRTLFFHYDLMREAGEAGVADIPASTGTFAIRIAPGASPESIMQTIDAMFENGPLRTLTTTEAEFNRQFVTMVGNIPALMASISGAVLFAVVIAAINTMLMAARERTRDLGILKALGFTDGSAFGLLLGESMVIALIGGGLGIAAALLSEAPISAALEAKFFPGYEIHPAWIGFAVALTLAIGLAAGIVPALQVRSLRSVEALRREE